MSELKIPALTLRENRLFSGEIYTTGKMFTLPPVVTVVTNLTSAQSSAFLDENSLRQKSTVLGESVMESKND